MIVVVGSINMDLVVRAERHPAPGETVLGTEYTVHPGGKGANQAVAAARAGSPVRMVGCLGNDAFGETLHQCLRAEGIDTRFVRRSSVPSGVALVTLSGDGQNSIVVAPGSNALLSPNDLRPEIFDGSSVAFCSFAIFIETGGISRRNVLQQTGWPQSP